MILNSKKQINFDKKKLTINFRKNYMIESKKNTCFSFFSFVKIYDC